MPARREVLALVGVAGAAALAGALVGALGLQKSTGAAELLATELDDLEGHRHRIGDWQGRVLLCNFWATWCAPCVQEMPLLSATQQKYAAKGLQIVGIGIDQVAKMRAFAAKIPISYPLLVGQSDTLTMLRGLGNASGGLPFTCLLDRRGLIVFRKAGALTEEELRAALGPFVS